jgi:hypothetical protein
MSENWQSRTLSEREIIRLVLAQKQRKGQGFVLLLSEGGQNLSSFGKAATSELVAN